MHDEPKYVPGAVLESGLLPAFTYPPDDNDHLGSPIHATTAPDHLVL